LLECESKLSASGTSAAHNNFRQYSGTQKLLLSLLNFTNQIIYRSCSQAVFPHTRSLPRSSGL
jgi:hypothetical protein